MSEEIVVVSGSRDWPVDKLWFVTQVLIEHRPQGATIRHGDAKRGVDRHVRLECVRLGWPQDAMPADWQLHGKAAGIIRNREMMLKHPVPSLVLGFRWGGSNGTGHAVRIAREKGIRTLVFTERDLRPDIAALDSDFEPITVSSSLGPDQRRTR